MLVILKLLQSLIRTLHSDGTPNQIATGIALGAALGLTPLFNLHNLLVLIALALLNVSFGAALLAMALFAPLGFLLDPAFDALGTWLLTDVAAVQPLFEFIDNTAVLALFNFTNTVVLGSLAAWVVLCAPIYLLARHAVVQYRATLGERVRKSRAYQAIRASRAYNVYSWFRE